jgi:hypothetical protein
LRKKNVCALKRALGICAKKHAGDVVATLASSMKHDKGMWREGNRKENGANFFVESILVGADETLYSICYEARKNQRQDLRPESVNTKSSSCF